MSKSRIETYGSAIDLLALDTDGAMKKVARSVAGAGLLSELVTQPSATIATVADGDMFFARDDDDSDAVKTATASVVATYIASELSITGGTWTPSVSATTGLTGSETIRRAAWTRHRRAGAFDTIRCSLRLEHTYNGAGPTRNITFSLPVDPGANFGDAFQLGGVANASDTPSSAGRVDGVSGAKTAILRWQSTTAAGAVGIYAEFSYDMQA